MKTRKTPVAMKRLVTILVAVGFVLAAGGVARAGLLNDALDAYWTLDETSGNFVDVINGNVGTPGGSPHGDGSNGVIGGALALSGSSDWVSVPHHSSIDFGTESFSVSFWLDGDGVSDNDTFIQKGTYGSGSESGKRYELLYKSGQMRFVIDDDSTKTQLETSSGPFLTGDFVHVAAVRDTAADVLRIYADGNPVATKPDSTGSISQTESMTIGNDFQLDNGFAGRIDDVALFRRALTPLEIKYLASGQSPNQAVEIASIIISTADGRGADAGLSESEGSGPGGGSGTGNRMYTRFNDKDRHETSWLRFDLATIPDLDEVLGASLNVTKWRSGEPNQMIEVFALNDDAPGQLWDEATVTYATAPGVDPDWRRDTRDLVSPGELTYIGRVRNPTSEGSVWRFDLPGLLDFLNADTDGVVTLLLESDQDAGDGNAFKTFATKETTALDGGSPSGPAGTWAPYLELAYVRAHPDVIPEPSSLLIWALGLLGLGWYGWRKRFRT